MEAGIFVIVLVVAVVILGFMAVVAVHQGMNYTVERFGKYTRTLSPGLAVIARASSTCSAPVWSSTRQGARTRGNGASSPPSPVTICLSMRSLTSTTRLQVIVSGSMLSLLPLQR